MRPHRHLGRSHRQGTAAIEYLAVLALLALAATTAVASFGTSVRDGVDLGTARVATLTGSGASCTSGTCEGGSTCFIGGTPVATPEGPQPIERIVAGDMVLSEDEATGVVVEKRVSATFVTAFRDVLDVSLRGIAEHLRATPGHLFFTLDRGWIPTEDLAPGEPLVDVDGAATEVEAISVVPDASTVYNFEVEDTHTYFVGDARVLVHNPLLETGAKIPNDRPGRLGPALYQYTSPDPARTAIIALSIDNAQSRVIEGTVLGYKANLPGSKTLSWADLSPSSLAEVDHLILVTHGKPGVVKYGDPPTYVDGRTIADLLSKAGYEAKPDSEILLSACNGGTPCMPNANGKNPFTKNKRTPSVGDEIAEDIRANVHAATSDDPKRANLGQPGFGRSSGASKSGTISSQYTDPTVFGGPYPRERPPQYPRLAVNDGSFRTCTSSK